MSENFIMTVGESLVAGGPAGTAAEPEIVIGDLNGPFGTAFANLIGNQSKGHSKVLAIMNTDVMVKPATLMVSKVTVNKERYTNHRWENSRPSPIVNLLIQAEEKVGIMLFQVNERGYRTK